MRPVTSLGQSPFAMGPTSSTDPAAHALVIPAAAAKKGQLRDHDSEPATVTNNGNNRNATVIALPFRRPGPSSVGAAAATTTGSGGAPPPSVVRLARRRAKSASSGALTVEYVTASPTRHTTSNTNESSRRRRALLGKGVAFSNAYDPEVIPDARAHIPSYDELLFNVAGLYHTLSFLHDPDYYGEDHSTTDTNSSSNGSELSEELPPERSVQLMIAEFLYRSAVYLGYPPASKVWIPGFRESKRFSVNDVKRWRRLAHHDWEKEEREAERAFATGATAAASSGPRTIRAVVSKWLERHRRHSAPARLRCPPVVPDDADLRRLVVVANSCISFGGFSFTERDIRKLCNVKIDALS